MTGEEPLIVTLAFDDATFAKLDALRRAHFPPERNQIAAHLTLFHKLPAHAGDRVLDVARAETARSKFLVTFSGMRSLGRGTALNVESPELLAIRATIARAFAADLSPQDAQGFRPHVTIQNKVSASDARSLYEHLQHDPPWTGEAAGLAVWRYCGGPWSLVADFEFAPPAG